MDNLSVLGCWYRELITLIGLILSFHLIIVLLCYTCFSYPLIQLLNITTSGRSYLLHMWSLHQTSLFIWSSLYSYVKYFFAAIYFQVMSNLFPNEKAIYFHLLSNLLSKDFMRCFLSLINSLVFCIKWGHVFMWSEIC